VRIRVEWPKKRSRGFEWSVPVEEWPDAESRELLEPDRWVTSVGDCERRYKRAERKRWAELSDDERKEERRLYSSLLGELAIDSLPRKPVPWHLYLGFAGDVADQPRGE
jgi:hypothetical protein